jgi:hypothetical protein
MVVDTAILQAETSLGPNPSSDSEHHHKSATHRESVTEIPMQDPSAFSRTDLGW